VKIKGKAAGNIVGGAVIICLVLVAEHFDKIPMRGGTSIDRTEHPVLFDIAFWSMITIAAGAMIYGFIRLLRGLD
jgi:hypothetical protein